MKVERVTLHDGVEIEFVHLPKRASTDPFHYGIGSSSMRIATVWRDEMYDVITGSEWSRKAPSYGLFGIHNDISIFIHLPDNYPVRDDRYRERLLYKSSSEPLKCEDFMDEVRSYRPQWVIELVEAATKPKQADDMKDVEKQLTKLLNDLRLKRTTPTAGSGRTDSGGADGQEGQDNREGPQEPTDPDPDRPEQPRKSKQEKSGTSQQRKRKAARTPMAAPKIEWVDSEDNVPVDMKARAGLYVQASNTLYLNQLYPAIDGMIEDIEGLHAGAGDPVKVRELVVSAVRTDMALHLGKAVVAALAKEGLSSWLRDDLARAFSPEALSIVADDADHLPGFISRRLKNSPEFRGAMAA